MHGEKLLMSAAFRMRQQSKSIKIGTRAMNSKMQARLVAADAAFDEMLQEAQEQIKALECVRLHTCSCSEESANGWLETRATAGSL
jgi:hypothetical protein